jgi:hypothetical protein
MMNFVYARHGTAAGWITGPSQWGASCRPMGHSARGVQHSLHLAANHTAHTRPLLRSVCQISVLTAHRGLLACHTVSFGLYRGFRRHILSPSSGKYILENTVSQHFHSRLNPQIYHRFQYKHYTCIPSLIRSTCQAHRILLYFTALRAPSEPG